MITMLIEVFDFKTTVASTVDQILHKVDEKTRTQLKIVAAI